MNNPQSRDPQIISKTVPVEHISIISRKPYADVRAALEKRVGRLGYHIRQLLTDRHIDELRDALKDVAGNDGLVIHYTAIHGEWLRLKGRQRNVVAYLIGNVLSAVEMTNTHFGAALYAPLRIVLYENEMGGCTFEYDKPSTLFSQYREGAIDSVAKSLDERLLKLLTSLAEI
jgi:uncharacterized protein (DUF302 family)